jgi:hypothetical protein
MGRHEDEFEFPGEREVGLIGTATRTRALWKKNGRAKTLGKELKQMYPPESPQVGTRSNRRKTTL